MNENIKIIIKKINHDSINKMDIIDYIKNSNLYVYKKLVLKIKLLKKKGIHSN